MCVQLLVLHTVGCGEPTPLLASERSERDTIRGVQIRAGAVYIYYKYSTLPRGILINIAPKVGIFPEAEGRGIHYRGCNIIDIPQGCALFLCLVFSNMTIAMILL